MSLWQKLHTLMRASAEEPVVAMVNHNSLRIFEQELRDAERSLSLARQQLAVVMAERRQLQRDIDQVASRLQQREAQALEALTKGADTLAEKLAEHIAADQEQHVTLQRHAARLEAQEARLKAQLQQAVQALKTYRRELALARANQSAQQARAHLHQASGGLSSTLDGLAASLGTLQARQTQEDDRQQALSDLDAELNGRDLDIQLQEAGIASAKQDTDAVLARLRERLSAEASRRATTTTTAAERTKSSE